MAACRPSRWLSGLLLLALAGGAAGQGQPPPPSGSDAMPQPEKPFEFKDEAVARQEMDQFVHHYDARGIRLPTRVDPALVEQYVREQLERQPPERPLPRPQVGRQLGDLAGFYGTRANAPDISAWLTREEESPRELLASAALVRALALVGDEAQWEQARAYYRYLLELPQAEEQLAELLPCYLAFVPREPPDGFLARIDGVLAKLRPRAREDYATGLALRELEDFRNVTLGRVQGAATLMQEIDAQADPELRRDRLVDFYLGSDQRYGEFVRPWATRRLVAQARADRRQLVPAFRRALERLSGPAREPLRARVFHALQFLGQELTVAERAEVDPEQKLQDLLAIE